MAEKKKSKTDLPKMTKRQLLTAGIIAVLCAVLFAWAGVAFLPETTGIFEREIVNDEYDMLTEALGSGSEIRQTIEARGRLYGVRLCVSNPDGNTAGEMHLSLLDESGVTVAENRTDLADIVDGFFHLFLLDNMVDAKDGARYTLVVAAAPDVDAGRVAFYKSGEKVAGHIGEEGEGNYDLSLFQLTENGVKQQGVLALQYVTKYTGNFIYTPYIIFSIILTVFAVAVYLMLFVFKVKLHVFFLTASLVLGTLFMFLIPLRTAPDEYVHIATAYHYANRIYGIDDAPGELTVRPGDEMFLETYDFDATDIFAYQEVYEGLFEGVPEGESGTIKARTATSVFPLLYLPQTLGILIARLLGFGKVGLLLMGRLFNLLFYSIVVMFAVKKMPFFKTMLTLVALLPMSLQLATSFSYDTYVIALSFLFIATVLNLAYKKETVVSRDMLLPAILMALIAPAKAVYLPLMLLILLIPKEKYQSKRAAWVSRGAVFLAAIALWSVFNLGVLKSSAGVSVSQPAISAPSVSSDSAVDGGGEQDIQSDNTDPVYEVGENNEAKQHFTFGYILQHIPQTILLLLRSVWEQSSLWLQGLIGGRLGEIIVINIEINWLFVIGLLLLLLLSTVRSEEDNFRLERKQRLGVFAIALSVAALFILACLTWTPINYETLFGVQGRYFLPALPLLLLTLRGKNLRFSKPADGILVFSECVLVILTILNAFLIIIAR